ncbi:TetR/AcrR family transcriptional regulator [Reyranella aquatilis]|uniref:TetR/AcrR family transcriptional regulator n=1 Tax=Reyranella aquatilis TaxID=2035356 RepID=UPI001E582E55|nr:TetR/AcrR family transcriptional regulator [Reyranella aquatilis]
MRGRPRDPRTRAAILVAARDLLERGGLTAVTIEAIAQKAGVSRPTIYRYWPNAPAVAMAAFLEKTGAASAAASPGSALSALRAQLHALADAFAAPAGRSVAAMVAAAQSETELAKAFRNEFIARNRDATWALLERCIADRSIAEPDDMDVTLDLIFGPLFYRLLMGHAPITRGFVDQLLDTVVRARRRRPVQPPAG